MTFSSKLSVPSVYSPNSRAYKVGKEKPGVTVSAQEGWNVVHNKTLRDRFKESIWNSVAQWVIGLFSTAQQQ